MFSNFGRRLFAPLLARTVTWLQATGVTPNALTLVGFLLTAVTALLLATGYFRIGAIMLLIASLFDMLDGSLARATAQSSTFGAFIDSTLDRYSESITFLALGIYYSQSPDYRIESILVLIILIGSLMVSYTRARAEALNVECKGGILQRPERVVLLILGLLVGWMQPVLWAMAILTNISALQRIYEVYSRTSQRPPAVPGANVIKPSDNHPI